MSNDGTYKFEDEQYEFLDENIKIFKVMFCEARFGYHKAYSPNARGVANYQHLLQTVVLTSMLDLV